MSRDILCRLTQGWFCRRAFWPLQRRVESAGLASLAAKIAELDSDIHPERYLSDSKRYEREHGRAAA